jgi:hypothetical protein
LEKLSLFNPQFQGKRFEDHSLPFELFTDLATYQSLLFQVARDIFFEENPDRRRVPNGFGDGVYLKLEQMEEGSTLLKVALAAASFFAGDLDTKPLFEKAQARIEQSITSASEDQPGQIRLSPEALEHFNKIGKNLLDDEAVTFNKNSIRQGRLNQQTRRTLVLASPAVTRFESRVVLRGQVAGIAKNPYSLTIETKRGTKLNLPLSKTEHSTAERAYSSYEEGMQVKIEGVGIYNKTNTLLSVKEVNSIVFLDVLDVPNRLETFYDYQDGWYNGEGSAFDKTELKWLADQFDYYFHTDILLPYTFPTPDGTIMFEWKKQEHDATLELDLANKSAYYHYYNSLTGDEHDEEGWNFSNPTAWNLLIEELTKYFKISPADNK